MIQVTWKEWGSGTWKYVERIFECECVVSLNDPNAGISTKRQVKQGLLPGKFDKSFDTRIIPRSAAESPNSGRPFSAWNGPGPVC